VIHRFTQIKDADAAPSKEELPMPEPAKRQAVYEDLCHIPENTVGEIIDGDLVVSPRPAMPHVICSSALGGELLPPYHFGRGGPGGWLILDEPEIHLGENVIVPNLTGWRKERLPTARDEHRFTVTPDWVCEILSPRSARIDRIKKMRVFAEFGVPFAWLVDPLLKTLEVYGLESGRWVVRGLYGEDEKVRAEPFVEIELDLANLWLKEPA
jgi:Uma2 family endonuclease